MFSAAASERRAHGGALGVGAGKSVIVVTMQPLDHAALGTLLSLTAEMSSDFERRTALQSIVGKIRGRSERSSFSMRPHASSRFESRQALESITPLIETPDAMPRSQNIASSFERCQALPALTARSAHRQQRGLGNPGCNRWHHIGLEIRIALADLAGACGGVARSSRATATSQVV